MTDIPLPAPSRPRGEMFANPDAPALQRFQIAWDSVSLGLLKECPRKYAYSILMGWRSKYESVHLTFGGLYHAGLETYDHFCASIGKLEGGLTDSEHDAATVAMVKRVFINAGEYQPEPCAVCEGNGVMSVGYDPLDPMAPTHIRCEACEGKGHRPDAPPVWHPWRSTDPNKNPWTLQRSLIMYVDHFRANPLHTVLLSNGKPAVELSFFYEVGEVNGISYGLCGHLDRMAKDPSDPHPKPVPHDRKTTKGQLNNQFWKQFAPNNQMNGYVTACSVHYEMPPNGIIIDAAQILVGDTNFARRFIPYPPAVVNEWLRETHVWVSLASLYAEAGFWPRNDKSCGNYGGCPYINVCSKSEAFRQDWLAADFHFNPWNPLLTRGDV